MLSFFGLGLLGAYHAHRLNASFERLIFSLFFVCIFYVTFASAYYHFMPDNFGLFWDRIAISIASTVFIMAIMSERVSVRFTKVLTLPAIILSIFAVIYWYDTERMGHGDLRPYLFIQIFSSIFVPAMLLLYPKKGDKFLWLAVLAYLVGRLTEYYDYGIYHFTAHIISGHTLKHIFMAIGVYFIYYYLFHVKYKNVSS